MNPPSELIAADFSNLNRAIIACERCERLREYCTRVAAEKRRSFASEDYWGRPVPNFGDPNARILIVGLAPAAHGANRTGRMFTGDRSGDFLFEAMHAAGLANQPTCAHADDGLTLKNCLITASAHCAPPGNKPTPAELAACAPFMDATYDALENLRVVVALGRLAFDQVLALYARRGWIARRGRAGYQFGHGAVLQTPLPASQIMPHAVPIVCSFHPSQQNTFTGLLTQPMLRDVFEKAKAIAAAL